MTSAIRVGANTTYRSRGCHHGRGLRVPGEVQLKDRTVAVETCRNCGAERIPEQPQAKWSTNHFGNCAECGGRYIRSESRRRLECSEICYQERTRREDRERQARERRRLAAESEAKARRDVERRRREYEEQRARVERPPPPHAVFAALPCPRCGNTGATVRPGEGAVCLMCSRPIEACEPGRREEAAAARG